MHQIVEIVLIVLCIMEVKAQYTIDQKQLYETCQSQRQGTTFDDLLTFINMSNKNVIKAINITNIEQKLDVLIKLNEKQQEQHDRQREQQHVQHDSVARQPGQQREEHSNHSLQFQLIIQSMEELNRMQNNDLQNLSQQYQLILQRIEAQNSTQNNDLQNLSQQHQLILQRMEDQNIKQNIDLKNLSQQHQLVLQGMKTQHLEQQTDLQNKCENITRILNSTMQHQTRVKNNATNEKREIEFNASLFLDNPRSLSIIHGSASIRGLTVLNSELFVVREYSTQVNVYDTNNLTPSRNIPITGSTRLSGIVASPRYSCLYISDAELKIVYRYNLSNNAISSWSAGGLCYRLSLTSTQNVLVTLWDTRKIKEYTPFGNLLREISLDSSMKYAYHSVQLSSDQFVDCHGTSPSFGGTLHRVCIVDTGGRILQCYGGPEEAGVGHLNSPSNLAVDRYGNMLVADYVNHRVVLLSPSLSHLGYVAIPNRTLRYPYALYLDLLTRRLYIGENINTGRMFVLTV